MKLHPAFIIGLVLFFASGLVFMGTLFSSGGWKKSKQLGVLVALVRGEKGTRRRWLTIGGFGGIVLGALFLFAGVAAEDAARVRRCQARCVAEGHTWGKLGPSMEQSMNRRNSAAFLACTCTGGAGPPIELRADGL